MEIQISQAQPLGDLKPIDVIIKIDKSKIITSKSSDLKVIEKEFKKEAKTLYDVLVHSLPQGTRHQLLIILLENYKNLYVGV